MRESKMDAQTPRNGKSSGAASEGVIIADMDFRVIALNEAAHATLNKFKGHTDSPEGLPGLPEEIVKVLSAHRKEGRESISFPVNGGNGEYSCRAFVLKPGGVSAIAPVFTLYIRREVSVTDAVHQVGTYYNLTHREQEALMGISMGLTSKQLAKRMKISPNTVKAFLRLIMIKMGAATRAGVVGKLLEQNGVSSDKQTYIDREV
jgi:DNA-binding CsgD family transcriptional regulator